MMNDEVTAVINRGSKNTKPPLSHSAAAILRTVVSTAR